MGSQARLVRLVGRVSFFLDGATRYRGGSVPMKNGGRALRSLV